MLSLDAVGVLFPAIPLAIVALNFRYTSLAGLMRELHAQLDKKLLKTAQKQVLHDELVIMARRMNFVKYSLFFLGLSFVFNTSTLFAFINQSERIAIFCMNTTIALMLIGLCFFCIETVLSTKALRMHISVAEIKNQQINNFRILWIRFISYIYQTSLKMSSSFIFKLKKWYQLCYCCYGYPPTLLRASSMIFGGARIKYLNWKQF